MNDARFMTLALSLGRRGMGNCAPNPAVGCVITKDGRIVGRGWTAPGGRPHAEVRALAQAGQAARGATVYVTLEPCAHHGQTPPCAQALIDAGVGRVVVATGDLDVRVAGRGIAMLQAAGITVDTGVCAAQAWEDHAGFFNRIVAHRPFVTLKLASSFDGRIATATGDSQWITDAPARRAVHAMRARHDAVMVGGGTARHDDPSLTVRDLGLRHQPMRIVLSRQLDLPLTGQLARSAVAIPLILCHGKSAPPDLRDAWSGLGARLVPCAERAGQLDMRDVMRQLAGAGLTRVFCEGGSSVAASLIAADLVDELIGFTAGVTIGGDGLPAIAPMGIDTLKASPRYALKSTRTLGPDVLHIWTRQSPLSSSCF